MEYGYGVASFHSEEAPETVIERGKAQGWPELSLNTVVSLTDPVLPEEQGEKLH